MFMLKGLLYLMKFLVCDVCVMGVLRWLVRVISRLWVFWQLELVQMLIFLLWVSRWVMFCSLVLLGCSIGCGKCIENGRLFFIVVWLMLVGRIIIVMLCWLSVVWQVRVIIWCVCFGLCICLQNIEQLVQIVLKLIFWGNFMFSCGVMIWLVIRIIGVWLCWVLQMLLMKCRLFGLQELVQVVRCLLMQDLVFVVKVVVFLWCMWIYWIWL